MEWLCRRLDFNVSGDTRRTRYGIAKLAQRFQVSLDRFPDITFRLFEGATGCDTTRQIGNICRPVAFGLFKNDCVSDAHYFFSNPAAFWMDFSVPAGTSSPACPGIVTTFGFVACW
jgi:hypothetical protein